MFRHGLDAPYCPYTLQQRMPGLVLTRAGSIPSAYYSSSDPKAFKEFLSKCDILIASLPSTPATQFMLKAEHFRMSLLQAGWYLLTHSRSTTEGRHLYQCRTG
jgi:lactate dehydrogenase-like 2-hydroxyacid dehydrogenase